MSVHVTIKENFSWFECAFDH